MIKIGDYVTRKSYNNDIVFEVTGIDDSIVYLKGVDYRLLADSEIKDLVLTNKAKDKDNGFFENIDEIKSLDRDEYFYIPAKILHIDSDNSYLKRCMSFYKQANLNAVGLCLKETEVPNRLKKILNEHKPDVLIITGHDAYYKKRKELRNESYKNSDNFVKAVKIARQYEKDNEKLVIIAGACQSNYEQLIKAGATFASSPKRINIHALDPAIIAISVSLSDRNQEINLINLLKKTKYGKDGMGGLRTKGMMYVGYPR